MQVALIGRGDRVALASRAEQLTTSQGISVAREVQRLWDVGFQPLNLAQPTSIQRTEATTEMRLLIFARVP